MRDLNITITDNRTGESFTVEFADDEPKVICPDSDCNTCSCHAHGDSERDPAADAFDISGFTNYPPLAEPGTEPFTEPSAIDPAAVEAADPFDAEQCDCSCHSISNEAIKRYLSSFCKCRNLPEMC